MILLPKRNARRGFTLVEVFIVISIIGIVAGLVIPNLMPNATQGLKAAAEVVAADLAWVRSLAVTGNTSYKITFDVPDNEYYVEHSGANAAFDQLPVSGFEKPGDTESRRTTCLSALPQVGPSARLAGVYAQAAGGSTTSVSTLEFAGLGETTRADITVVWLSAGQGKARRFVPILVDPVTGLASTGKITNISPALAVVDASGVASLQSGGG